MKDADGYRHFLLVNQIVEDHRHAPVTFGLDVTCSVLKNHDARGFGRIVLLGHIDPIVADRARKNLAGPRILGDLALGNSGLDLGIGPKRVVVNGEGRFCPKYLSESKPKNIAQRTYDFS